MRDNRIAARILNHVTKQVITLEMSCQWMRNRITKDTEKTLKYRPLRWELKQQYPGYKVEQFNIIIDALGGWCKELDTSMPKLLGDKGQNVLLKMQKSVISSTVNIARTFKVAVQVQSNN